jgi:type IV secretion/conjugal transfer VirB4 family ATPase
LLLNFWKLFNKPKPYQYTTEVGVFKEPPTVSGLVPWRYVDVNSGVIHGKDDTMIAVFEFRGPDMNSATDAELVHFNANINNVIKNLGTGYVLYFEAQRHYSSNYHKSDMPSPLLQQMEDERASYYDSQEHFESNYYFIVCYEPPNVLKAKIIDAFFANSKHRGQQADKDLKIYTDTTRKFLDNVSVIGALLEQFFPEIRALNAEEAISFLHSTVSTNRQIVKLNPHREISSCICDSPLLGGMEMKLGDKYMKLITILNFPPVSTPGIFDNLNALNMEYRWVSRFICLSKNDSQKELEDWKQKWSQQQKSLPTHIREAITKTPMVDALNETAVENKEDVSASLIELGQDAVSYGYYTITVIVTDTDKDICKEKANKVLETIQSLGFVGFIESTNSMEAWWGTLPGCYRANIRRPIVNSLNFCHLAPLIAPWAGDLDNRHLKGPALLYTDTNGYTPFRLNLHVGDVGHTMICGPSGSGKSVLLNTLEAHFLKYPDAKVFIFDKAASSRALTIAVGGNFYNLAAEGGSELSFQPLARITEPTEIKWAKEWILAYLKSQNLSVTPKIDNHVWEALKSLATMPPEQRTLSVFCTMVQNAEIRLALRQLTTDGSYGKLFDNQRDISGSGHWQVYEMETLMATPTIVPATLDYLFHRIETSLKETSGPSIIVLDECWLFFDNPAFKNKLKEYFKDMRKKNTSIIFATQNLADVANKPDLLTTVMENCPNKIYLPNPNAINPQNKELYKTFGCNQQTDCNYSKYDT